MVGAWLGTYGVHFRTFLVSRTTGAWCVGVGPRELLGRAAETGCESTSQDIDCTGDPAL